MGAGKGKDYGNTKNKAGNFSDNIANLIKDYALSASGFFGEKVNDTVRHIVSEHPIATMRDFLKKITKGANIIEMKNGKGCIANFPNGFQITYRERPSSDSSPVVENWTNIRKLNASSTV